LCTRHFLQGNPENYLGKYFRDHIKLRLLAPTYDAILLQRGIAEFFSATPRPFLGVSSLNLAAPSGAAFF
jgi:hypothetical protein